MLNTHTVNLTTYSGSNSGRRHYYKAAIEINANRQGAGTVRAGCGVAMKAAAEHALSGLTDRQHV